MYCLFEYGVFLFAGNGFFHLSHDVLNPMYCLYEYGVFLFAGNGFSIYLTMC